MEEIKTKTENLILYICDKMKDDPKFGSIKLNKALYLIDNVHYAHYGKPVSDLTYIKQKQGPTPVPKQFLSIRSSLIERNMLELREKIVWDFYIQKVPVCLVDLDIDNAFSASEVSFIDKVLDKIKSFNGKEMSDYTHYLAAWRLAEINEEMPFFTFLINTVETSATDFLWAEKIADERGSKRK
jgi:hypothetical protein